MKVLVATQELRGRTIGKVPDRLVRGSLATFCYVPEGELVMPLVCWEVIDCQHNNVACHYSLGGVDTHKTTTNFKVVEQSITPKELEDKFFASLKAQGWVESEIWKMPLPFWQEVARSFAGAVTRAASKFPVGDVLSKSSCTFWSRKNPRRSTKVVVTPPRNLSPKA